MIRNVDGGPATTLRIDPAIKIIQMSLTPEWLIINSEKPLALSDLYAINRASGQTIMLAEDSFGAHVSDGSWVAWHEVKDSRASAHTLMAHDLGRQETFEVFFPSFGGPLGLSAGRLAYQPFENEISYIDLATRTHHTYPLETRGYTNRLAIAGDLIIWSRPVVAGAENYRIVALDMASGARREITTTSDRTIWTLSRTPQPVVIWLDIQYRQGEAVAPSLKAAWISPGAPPPAMEPEPASAQPGALYFPVTQHNLAPPFSGYWQQNGGLPQFGYPLAARFAEVNPDLGQALPTQYLERQRFEWHAENAGTAYEVLLGRLGADLLGSQGRDWRAEGHAQLGATQLEGECQHFEVTDRTVCGPFLAYWRAHGLDLGQPGLTYAESLALFGLPLTAPRSETNPDGDTVIAQWFERARFEYHPANPPAYQVLLGRLGAELLARRGWTP